VSEPTPTPAVSVNPPRTTAAAEDYLERIAALIRNKGYARVVDIAAELKISQASVTTMVQRLDGEGLVKYEKYRGMVLTDAGEAVAARIAHRHELLTRLLRFFQLPEDVIFRDVEGMEHHISGETLAALERLTRHLDAHPEIVAELRE
jgi:Mn-dependent DtxR family transcriptional regulator